MTCIQGGREDLPEFAAAGDAVKPQPQGAAETIRFEAIPSHLHASVNEDVELLIERMRLAGFGQAVVFDITRPDVGIPVVRLVVPRAESWNFFHMHTGRAAFGERVLRQIGMVDQETAH
jgi:ribosomal protein S12 methylthiotransferase accessory factor